MAPETEPIWDVFISHASEDKAGFVEPLARAIEECGYAVWYDRFTLKWGDSLRQSIERGLAYSRYGIVVLSQAFFRKRWPQTELDGLFARESDGGKVILPIWYGVTEQEVRARSPVIAGRLAMSSDEGIEGIVQALQDVIGLPSKDPTPRQVKDIEATGSVPHLESLAKNIWWQAQKNPDNLELLGKLDVILKELKELKIQDVRPLETPTIVSPQRTPEVSRGVPDPPKVSKYDEFVAQGRSGTSRDVDSLMNRIASESDIATVKLVDFALSLVTNREGMNRIKDFLFNGSRIQRNYAALYFKRRNEHELLTQAYKEGKIDRAQAFSR